MHWTQLDAELAPWVEEYVPGGHGVQLYDPDALQLPRGQHAPEPEALYVLGAQVWQDAELAALNVFDPHATHEAKVELPM